MRQGIAFLIWMAVVGPGFAAGIPATRASGEPIEPIPLSIEADPALVRLGEKLFAERRLSHDQRRSCADCHPLGRAGVDGLARSRATNDVKLLRNTPTVFNVAYDLFLNWDGGSERLQPHDEKVILSPALMATTWPELIARLSADPAYVADFAALPHPGISKGNVLDAIAAYEQSLITPNSRFDRFLRGERSALTPEEQRGYQLFKSYGCVACHQGINVGGNLVQKFGVFADTKASRKAGDPVDLGRYEITHRVRDREVFRVPSLRNVAMTAPYFHDGRAPTLEAAVDTMARVQVGRTLQPDQIHEIALFLATLTGEYRGQPLDRAGQGYAP